VVWTKGQPVTKLDDLLDGKYKRIAIANPTTRRTAGRPRRASQVDLWDKLQDRMVLAESVQAAMTWAREGSVDVAFVAQSLAMPTARGHRTRSTLRCTRRSTR